MKAYEFEVDNKRNNQREELFILTVVERVLAGFISSISFVDQAQFYDLLQKRQQNKAFVQPLHLQIMRMVKKNLLKKQTPIKESLVNYEIRTVASSSIDMRKGYIHSFSNRNQNNKEQQTTENEGQFLGLKQSQKGKHLMLDRTYHSGIVNKNAYSTRSQQQSETNNKFINPFQFVSPNSTQLDTNNTKDNQTAQQQGVSEGTLTKINEKAFINIVSQDGEIEQQENFIISNNQNFQGEYQQEKKVTESNQLFVNKNQPYLDQQLQEQHNRMMNAEKLGRQNTVIKSDNTAHNELPQQAISRKMSQNFPMGSDSSKMDLKEKLQKYYSNEEDFSSSRKPMSQSDRIKQITCGTYTELHKLENSNDNEFHVQSAKCLEKNEKINQMEKRQKNLNQQQVKFAYMHGKTEEMDQNNQVQSIRSKQLNSPKKSLDVDNPVGNFLSLPPSSRTLMSGKSTKTKLKTLQSNEQKLQQSDENQEDQINKDNSNSKDESQLSLLDQSLHQTDKTNSNLRPSTTNVELKKVNDYPQFQTHCNIELQNKQNQNLLQQTSMTSIMHDEDNFNNQAFSQQINIQVSKCDPVQPTNNIIVEESVEGSPNCKTSSYHPQGTQFSLLKLDEQKVSPSFQNQYEKQQYSPSQNQIPTSTLIPQSQPNLSITQSQTKMLIPINNTSSSNKNNRSSNKSKSQVKDAQFQQQRSEDSQPESKLTIESSQGEKSNRSKIIKNAKQLKLPAAAVALNFARRKSSNQISPLDPKKVEQIEKEKQRQLEYQRQVEKMKYERELMEQYKIPDNMPLHQKKAIIDQLINQLEGISDQDVKYQIMLYKQRQEQIYNISKQDIQFSQSLNVCYDELYHLSEQKLKILGKDDPTKIQFLKFEDQLQTNFPGQSKQFNLDPESPLKRNFKFLSKLDPVEIEKQINRVNEFKQETALLRFFQSFNSQYEKEVNQCDLDYPTEKDRENPPEFQRGMLPKATMRRRKNKNKSTKIMISTFRIDPKQMEKVLQKTEKIKHVGQFLL